MPEIITRNIEAIPYQGGTLRTAQPFSAAVQLTPTRMVWTYCQNNPNWRFFVIVDTPEGWANGGTPTVTVSRMQDQKAYRGISLQMARLNDNTFVVIDAQGPNSQFWSYEVFEIDQDNVFTKTASNLDAYDILLNNNFQLGYMASYGGNNSKFNNLTTLVPVADNMLVMAFYDSSANPRFSTFVYNPTTKAVTTPTTSNSLGSISYSGSLEIYWRDIPGSTRKAVTYKNYNASNSWTTTDSNFLTVIFNTNGTVFATFRTSIVRLGNPANLAALDAVAMSETRMSRLNWTWAYYYGQTSGNLVNDGFGSFTSTTSSAGMIALPMDANYIMAFDRTHFNTDTSGTLKAKIIRRDDANFVSQSSGSAASVTGFDIAATWIQPWFNDARPRMLPNGDVFWWGLDATGRLAWNVLKNAA